jgi:hypothetical protein
MSPKGYENIVKIVFPRLLNNTFIKFTLFEHSRIKINWFITRESESAMLLSEAWEKNQLDKKIEGYSALTLKTYCFQYNLLLKFFGDIDMNEFTIEKLKSYLIEAGEHLKPSSLGQRVHCI